MKTLYLDCFSGISGDMMIGALIDVGADPTVLEEELKKLNIEEEYELQWNKVVKNGITSTKFDVILKKHAHDHDHHHEHSHKHDHDHHHHEHSHKHDHDHHHEHNHEQDHDHHHEHSHEQDHDHHHEHSHEHDHNHHHEHHHHRTYKDIVHLIETAGFSKQITQTALNIFRKIGVAEGHIHGIPLDKVHFHEVGAVDSIIDIVGAAILIHQLEIKKVKSSSIPVGTGRIHIDHGIYPVPAPATLEMLIGVPIEQSDVRFELTTPTGAAIVAVLAEEFCSIPSMKIHAIGYGAGTKTFKDRPNVLRVVIGE
ncbi:LarC family nickel insertion protein [Metabacillus litoralis]|uniref:LarC family nickel insertion protein n=1 Tax=Metabacillus litoralis TaxID=152268 RepID=A0A5C6VYG0_9BACI|nr:LarC family nickel insertion protein [Metabacillus litoralis]TXC90620.1 LarC family nickel insertion protein [Metabacillus litoralis]